MEEEGDVVTVLTETPDYIVENGLRYVVPYHYTFEVYAKGRWLGKTLLETLVREFRAESADYYRHAIESGRILINGRHVAPTHVLINGDRLTHRLHRHEPPVSAQPIKIIAVNDDVVVVDKPPSIPVHPCGRYRHNSMTFLLAREHDMPSLRNVHRLDRLTSGLLMFARTQAIAQQMEKLISGRSVEKVYLCKVIGVFPEEAIECQAPIKVVVHRLGLCRVAADGKECHTRFERLSTDGETSIVKCYPRTGRTHQIRVHLQYLGHPISNDPLYAHSVWGDDRGRGGVSDGVFESAVQILNTEMAAPPAPADVLHAAKRPPEDGAPTEPSPKRPRVGGAEDHGPCEGNSEPRPSSTASEGDSQPIILGHGTLPPNRILAMWAQHRDALCSECKVLRPDPPPSERCIYLHAWRYAGPGWDYQTPLPQWAGDAAAVGAAAPQVERSVDQGGTVPEVEGSVDQEGTAPEVEAEVDQEGTAPEVEGSVDQEGTAPEVEAEVEGTVTAAHR